MQNERPDGPADHHRIPLSKRLEALPTSGIREMSDLARRTPDVLHLEIGDPDFRTPSHITDQTLEWVSHNRVGYPPTAGIPELRLALAEKVTSQDGIACGPEHIVVTLGATGSLYLSLLATVGPGDEVLIPDPGWAGYPSIVALTGARMTSYQLDPDDRFALRPDSVVPSLSDRTKVIILNTPNNPTGAVYGEPELKALRTLAEDQGIWIISDEAYQDVVFEGVHHSIGTTNDLDSSSVLSVFSFSKSHAMTGWRIGYVVAPARVAEGITRIQSAVAPPPTVSQRAALEALAGPQDHIPQMLDLYRSRRDLITGLLDEADVSYLHPQGTFYLLVDIRPTGLTSEDYAKSLLQEASVSTTPGSAFGQQSEGFVRISFACEEEILHKGVRRLIDHLLEKRQRPPDQPSNEANSTQQIDH